MNVFNFASMEKKKNSQIQQVCVRKGRSYDNSNEECTKLKIKGGYITHMGSETTYGDTPNAGHTNGHSLNNMLMRRKIENVDNDEWKIKQPVLFCDKSGNHKKIDVLVYPVCDQNNFYHLREKKSDRPGKYLHAHSASNPGEGKQICTKKFVQKGRINEAFFTCGNKYKLEQGFIEGEDEKKKKKKNSPATEMLSEMGTSQDDKNLVHYCHIGCARPFTHQLKNTHGMSCPVGYNVSDGVCFSCKGKNNEGNIPTVFYANMEENSLHGCANCVKSNGGKQHFVSSPHGGTCTQDGFHEKDSTMLPKTCTHTLPNSSSEINSPHPLKLESNSGRAERMLSGSLHTYSGTIRGRNVSSIISKGEQGEWSSDGPHGFDRPLLCDSLHHCGDVDGGTENKSLKLCKSRSKQHTDWCPLKGDMHMMKGSRSNRSPFMKRVDVATRKGACGGVENKSNLICGGRLPSKSSLTCEDGLGSVARRVCRIIPDPTPQGERRLKDPRGRQGIIHTIARSLSEVLIENDGELGKAEVPGEGKRTEPLYLSRREETETNEENGGDNVVAFNCPGDVNTFQEDASIMDKHAEDMHDMSTGGEEDTRDVYITYDEGGGDNVVCSSRSDDVKQAKSSTHESFTTEVSFENGSEREEEDSAERIDHGTSSVASSVEHNETHAPDLSDDSGKAKNRGKSCEEDLGMKRIMQLLMLLERERRRSGRVGERKKTEGIKTGRKGTHEREEGDAHMYFAKYVDEIFRREEEAQDGYMGGETTEGDREKIIDTNGGGAEKWCATLLDKVEEHVGALDISLNEILQLNKVKKIFWYLYMKFKLADSITIEKFCELLKEKINEEMSKNYFKEYVMWENFQSFCRKNVGNFDYKMMILENLFCLLKSYPLDYEENKGCFYMLNPQRNKMMQSSSLYGEKNANVHLMKNKMNYLKLTREINIHFKNNFFFLDKIFIPKDAFFFVKDIEDIGLKDDSSKTLYVHQGLVQDLNEESEEKNSFDGFYAGNPPYQSDYYRYVRKKKVQSKMRKMKEFILYYYGFPSVQHFFEALLEFEREYKKANRGCTSLNGRVVEQEVSHMLELTSMLYAKYGREPCVKGCSDAHGGVIPCQCYSSHLEACPLEGHEVDMEKKTGYVNSMAQTTESNRHMGLKIPDTGKRHHSECTYEEQMKCDMSARFAKWKKEDQQNKLNMDSLETNVMREKVGTEVFPCECGPHCSEGAEPYWLSETIEEVSCTYEKFFNTVDAGNKVKEINLRTLKLFTENLSKLKGYPNFTSVDEVFWGICFSDPDLPKHILCEKKIFPKHISFNGFMRSMRYVPYVIPDFPVPSRHFISLYKSEKANEVFNSRNAFLNLLKYEGKNREMVLLRNKIIYDIVKLFVLLSSNFGVETGKYGKAAGVPHGDADPMVESSYYINYKCYLRKGRECASNRGEYEDTSSSCSLDYIPSSLDDEVGDDHEEGALSTGEKNSERKVQVPHQGYHITHSTLEHANRKKENNEQPYSTSNHLDEGSASAVEELLVRTNKKMSYKYVPKWHMSNDMFLSRLVSFDEIQISLENIYPLFMIQTALIYMIHISCCTLEEDEWRYFFEGAFTLYNTLTPEEVALRYIKLKGGQFFKLSNIKFNKNINLHQVFMRIPENMQCAEIYRLAINGENTSTGYSAEPFDIYHLMFVARVFWYIFLYSDNFLLLRSSLFWDAPE
ncbi:hypothetical protein AK88_02537 [Plasmodium fragile]|uniref:Uncharacterized protein n=1 Tax=Plasmodium fragile TaxID=5857 RepID=A0A0D9QQ19_PLAFR|nr:uncharacterized protein AK88_02537 [Plasmodium fragile]KJP87781.1 hypothetical protein AK88_02537 [Plasmodium fragile]